jgi:hypothetical protein
MKLALGITVLVVAICFVSYKCREAKQPDDGNRNYIDWNTGQRSEGKPMPSDQQLREMQKRMAATTQES